MAQRSLDTEAQFLKGVGPRGAVGLAKLGLHTVGDVLYHLPRRYDDRRNIPPIAQTRPGHWATVRGTLIRVDGRPTRGGMVILKATIEDESGMITLTWFNQPWIRRKLSDYQGEILAYGMVKEAAWGHEINSPEWELIGDDTDPEEFARIVPVYPLTDGVAQKTMRRAARAAVESYLDFVVDPLPTSILREHKLKGLPWCLRQIHMPTSEEERLEARRRLVFEEFFYMQTALAMRRAETQQELGIAFPIADLVGGVGRSALGVGSEGVRREASGVRGGEGIGRSALGVRGDQSDRPDPSDLSNLSNSSDPNAQRLTPNAFLPDASRLTPHASKAAVVKKPKRSSHLFEEEQEAKRAGEPLWDQIHRMLPFDLTGAQRRVIEEIFSDMERPHPMNRLLQGDVGSGKTAVAASAILAAIRSGYQAALMAPTEILAEQHYVTLHQLFEPLGIDVVLLVGKQTATQKKKATEQTASGQAKIAIGTHALIQEGVTFDRLGLVVVDEQHRFGVLQRAALRGKGIGNPDVLVMTATPIPRTLTMTLYGDLELSVIDEMPPGRKPIRTHWKQPFERSAVYAGVRKLVQEGRQAYFVCPMVSESEKMLAQAATDLHYRLSNADFHDLRVGLLHGQMRPKDKEEVMESFRRHELDILVSTTVIEVGVDVPNASTMVIEDANRFGLSQLHQLRGRVGRGAHQSFCVMIADTKGEDARARMDVMVATADGFKIAEEDLKLRGPGELAGTKQSGNLDFKIADLVQDGRMLEVARQAAMELVAKDPHLAAPEHALILERVKERRGEMAVITVS